MTPSEERGSLGRTLTQRGQDALALSDNASDMEKQAAARDLLLVVRGIDSPDGSLLNGDHGYKPLAPAEYFTRMRKIVEDGAQIETPASRDFHAIQDENEKYTHAKERLPFWKANLANPAGHVFAAHMVGTPISDEELPEDLTPEDRALAARERVKYEYERSPQSAMDAGLNEPGPVLPGRDAGLPASNAGQFADFNPDEQKRLADIKDRVARRRVIAEYEARMKAENVVMQFDSVKGLISDPAQDMIKQALKTNESPGNQWLETFRALPLPEQQIAATIIFNAKHTENDGFLVAAAKGFLETAVQIPRDAARKYFVDGVMRQTMTDSEWNQHVQTRALWTQMVAEKPQEFGPVPAAFIGAIVNVPYMLEAMVPVVGIAMVAGQMADEYEQRVSAEGGDVTSLDFRTRMLATSVAAAATEKWQGFTAFGTPTAIQTRLVYSQFWKSIYKTGKVLAATAGEASEQTAQEVAQQALEEDFVAYGLGKDEARAAAEGAVQTIKDAGGMMLVTAGFGTGSKAGRLNFDKRLSIDETISARLHAQNVIGKYDNITDKGIREDRAAIGSLRDLWFKAGNQDRAVQSFRDIGMPDLHARAFASMFRDEFTAIMTSDKLTPAQKGRMIGQNTDARGWLLRAMPDAELTEGPDGGFSFARTLNGVKTVYNVAYHSGGDFDMNTEEAATSITQALQDATRGRPAAEQVNMTPKQWLALSPENKKLLVDQHEIRVNGFFTPVSKEHGVTEGSLAVLAGTIHLDRAAHPATLFHEYFHGFTRMLKDAGAWTEADIAKARAEFGPGRIAGEDFNEEAAADAFQGFVAGKVNPPEKSVLRHLWNALATLMNAIQGKKQAAATASTARESMFEQTASGNFTGIPVATIASTESARQAQDARQSPRVAQGRTLEPAKASGVTLTTLDTPEPKVALYAPGDAITGSLTNPDGKRRKGSLGTVDEVITNPDGSFSYKVRWENGKQSVQPESFFFVEPTTQAALPTPADSQIRPLTTRTTRGTSTGNQADTPDVEKATPNVASPKNDGGVSFSPVQEAAAREEAAKVAAIKGQKGRFETTTPDGSVKVSGYYAVMPLDGPITSDRPGYPEDLQGRDRDNVASRIQIQKIARAPQPARLFESPETDGGAPILTHGMHVLSGNGRMLGLREAAKLGNLEEYDRWVREKARDLGIEIPAGIEHPVLVRILDSTTDPKELARISELSNRSRVLARGQAETAEADAKTILSGGLLSLYAPDASGNMFAAGNREFMSGFIRATHDDSLVDSDGHPTDAAGDRVRRAMLAIIAGRGPDARNVIRALVEESRAVGMARIVDGAAKAAGELVSLADLKPEYSLLDELALALREFMQFKLDGAVNVREWVGQAGLFGPARPSIIDKLIVQMGERNTAGGIYAMLKDYYERSRLIDTKTGDMFGAPLTSKEAVLDLAIKATIQESARYSVSARARREDLTAPADVTHEAAIEALSALAGRDLVNIDTGIIAQVNVKQRNKIVSIAALEKSQANGFAANKHNAAASIIDRLWKHAVLLDNRADRAGDKNIASIKRFAAPILFDGETAIAYITAKESVRAGHRIYSLELTEIERLRDKGNRLDAQGDQRATHGAFQEKLQTLGNTLNEERATSGASADKLANLLAEVNGKDDPNATPPGTRYSISAAAEKRAGKQFRKLIEGEYEAAEKQARARFKESESDKPVTYGSHIIVHNPDTPGVRDHARRHDLLLQRRTRGEAAIQAETDRLTADPLATDRQRREWARVSYSYSLAESNDFADLLDQAELADVEIIPIHSPSFAARQVGNVLFISDPESGQYEIQKALFRTALEGGSPSAQRLVERVDVNSQAFIQFTRLFTDINAALGLPAPDRQTVAREIAAQLFAADADTAAQLMQPSGSSVDIGKVFSMDIGKAFADPDAAVNDVLSIMDDWDSGQVSVQQKFRYSVSASQGQSEQLAQAFADWTSKRAYIDNAGNYRIRDMAEVAGIMTPVQGGKGQIAPWNKAVKAAFPDVAAFHQAAQQGTIPGARQQSFRYSVSASQDRDYLAAVEKGDTAEAQRMADEAAKAAGYTVKAYHGTNARFNKFKASHGSALWFSEDKDKITRGESGASGTARVMEVYLRPGRIAGWKEYELLLEMQLIRDYDSVKLDDDWIVFNPEQVKSSDAITRKAGRVIPLSERFNSASPDIRYSVSANAREVLAAYDFVTNHAPVAELTGNEFQRDGKKLTEKVFEFYRTQYAGTVSNPEIGPVTLDKASVADSLAHGIGSLKAAAYAAVPEVIRVGAIFDRQENWKGRGHGAFVLVAPIRIGGTDYVCEVVVRRNKNRTAFYIHEIEEKKKIESAFKTPTEGSAPRSSKLILSKLLAEVNGNSSATPPPPPARPPAPRNSMQASAGKYSNESKLVADAAARILAGKPADATQYDRLASVLNTGKTGQQIVDQAKTLAESEAGKAAKAALDGADPTEAFTKLAKANELDVLRAAVRKGASAHASLAEAGQKAIDSGTKAILAEVRGEDLQTFVVDTGIDLTKTLLNALPESFNDRPQAAADPANQPSQPEQSVEQLAREVTPEELAARSAKSVNLIDLVKNWWAEERAKRQKRAEERAAILDRGGSLSDEQAAQEQDDASALAAIPPALLEASAVNLNSAQEVAHLFRVWVGQWMIDHSAGKVTSQNVWQDAESVEKYRKTIVQQLQDMANKLVAATDHALPNIMRTIGDIAPSMSVSQIERMSALVIASIQRNAIRQKQQTLTDNLAAIIKKKAVDGPEFDPTKRDVKRKVTAEVERIARLLAKVIYYTDRKVAAEIERINAEIEQQTQALANSHNPEANIESDFRFYALNLERMMLERYGGLKYRMPAEILAAKDEIENWLTVERQRIEERWTRIAEEDDANATDLAGGIERDPDQHGRPGKEGWFSSLVDSLVATTDHRLRNLVRFARGEPLARSRAVIDRLRLLMGEGSEVYTATLDRYRRENTQLIIDASGGHAADFLKHLDEPIPEDMARTLSNQGWIPTASSRGMTYGQAVQLYASITQSFYADNVIDFNRQEHARILESMLSAADLKLVNGLRRLYAARREELSDVVREITGMPVWSPDPNYMPVQMFLGARGGLITEARAWSPLAAALTPRVKNGRDFDESADVLSMLSRSVENSARAISFGGRGVRIRGIIGRQSVQNAILRYHGKEQLSKLLEQVNDHLMGIDEHAGGGDVKLVRAASQITSYTALSWNMLSTAKQLGGVVSWATVLEGGFKDMFQGMIDFDRQTMRELMDSDGFRARYGAGMVKEIQEAITDSSGRAGFVKRLYQAGFQPLQAADMVAALAVGTGIYKAKRNALIDQGVEPATAMRQAKTLTFVAIEESQQSARPENQPAILRRYGPIARLFVQFASAPLLQLSHEVHAAREAAAGVAGAREKLVRIMFVNHILMPLIMQTVTAMFNRLLGDDEDEDFWTELAVQMAVGPFSRLIFLGSAGENTIRTIFRLHRNFSGRSVPAESALRLFDQGVVTSLDFINMDWDKAQADLVQMIKSTGAPQRHLIKAWKNYSE